MTDDKLFGKGREDMIKKILPVIAGLCVLAVAVMILALSLGGKTGEFSAPPFDPAAKTGTPDVPQDAGYGEMDAKAFSFSVAGELAVENSETDVWLTNPDKNTVWLKVRILDGNNNVLGESGLIRPGEYVKSVKLDSVPKSSTGVSLKIMAYEPDTYYSAGSAKLMTTLTVS